MAINDLRTWIDLLDREGELARVTEEVDWDREIGGILRQVCDTGGPALLFENIRDYGNTACTTLFTGSLATFPRVALMLGLPKATPYREIIRVWRERSKKPIKPRRVSRAPCKDNILLGDEVDLYQLPVPHWSKFDGGRYISTFAGVVTRDADTGWENTGVYRAAILDRQTTTMAIAQGQHIWYHWRTWRRRGRNMPLAIAIGGDPLLPAVGSAPVPLQVDEWDVQGGLRQEPVELVPCETVDLSVPAASEIVLEGEVITDVATFADDGPFSEYTGHYGGKSRFPVFKVRCMTFRDKPIFQGTITGMPITEDHRISAVSHSAIIWDLLDSRMTGVTGVNADPSTAYANIIVQVNNSYYGQVQQAAANIWSSALSNVMGKQVIVCDEDVDIYNLDRVFWALGYRVDPLRDIIPFPGWINALDPIVHPKDRLGFGGNQGTRLLIDATKAIDKPRSDALGGERFAPLAYPDGETMDRVRKKWHRYMAR